jgi:hypothetical protein
MPQVQEEEKAREYSPEQEEEKVREDLLNEEIGVRSRRARKTNKFQRQANTDSEGAADPDSDFGGFSDLD